MKKQKLLKIYCLVLLFIFMAPGLFAQAYINFAEALQKSLYFYDAEKSGPGITGGRLPWRADSELSDAVVPLISRPTETKEAGVVLSQEFIDKYRDILDPDGNGTLDLSGGMHDAGDHVKFGLPQSYTAATLNWGLYEFEQAFRDIGEYEHMVEISRWFTDYFLRSAFLDADGNLIAFCYQVGEGNVDHDYWGPPELQDPEIYPRPAYFATVETPASDQCSNAATALAISYLIFKDEDPVYAERCLTTAFALYDFAVANRGLGYAGPFYQSGYDEDELAWAASWLYTITKDMTYIDHITSRDADGFYTGYMSRIIDDPGDTWQNIWVHCWDAVWGGVFMQLTILFPEDEQFDYFARWNIEYWSGGEVPHAEAGDTSFVFYTPGGYAMLNTWGSARYNAAAQFCAMVYHKYKNRPDMAAWARGQMEYIMGDNGMGRSYIVGYSDDYARHPHHRAAHGSMTNNLLDPPEHRHILWGALVGGPDALDKHVDATDDYIYNEVAIDYNAGLVGALAGHYEFFGRNEGHLPVADFPPPEPPFDEAYRIKAKLSQENEQRSQVTVQVHAEVILPPFYETELMCRYFFDIDEMVAIGQNIENVTVEVLYDENADSYDGPALVTGPHPWDAKNNVYYVEIDWTGRKLRSDRELLIAIVADQGPGWDFYWDPLNDYSHQGLGEEYSGTENIPMYVGGNLVYGKEPPITGPEVTPPPTGGTPSPEPVMDLKVQYKCLSPETNSSQINPCVDIVNQGTVKVNYSDLRLRYYYTMEGSGPEEFQVDSAAMGKTNVTGLLKEGYLEVGFEAATGIIPGGTSGGEIKLHLNKVDWSPYDQSDDYSFDPAYSDYGDYEYITLYHKGVLVWGLDPGGSPPEPTPTPILTGDVNNSGVVDILDALMIAQYSVGLNPEGFNAAPGDTNKDGSVNIVDALRVAQFYVGLIPSL